MQCSWIVPEVCASALALGISLLGCQATARSAAVFAGHPQSPMVPSRAVGVLGSLPIGYATLGRVSADCSPAQVSRSWEAEWLSDVDCSTERLQAAMKERASEVGGELLIDLGCSSHRLHAGRLRYECRAQVAHPRETRAPRPGPWALGRVSEARPDAPTRVSEAWNIRVDFTSTRAEAARAPRVPTEVRELPELGAGDIALGELVTGCELGCTERGAREGLLAAAARRGATAVAAASCRPRAQGWLCLGTAAAHAIDPQGSHAAR
jgi:hypothetical protein